MKAFLKIMKHIVGQETNFLGRIQVVVKSARKWSVCLKADSVARVRGGSELPVVINVYIEIISAERKL